MKKCVFINPYFGKLPKMLPVFLKTCEKNPDFEWIFFTDDDTEFDYPSNVKRIMMTFGELQELAQSKFDFPIALEQPYKLCDYKPAYGLIFEEYIKEYKYWGHCDIDTIMGNLSNFLTDSFLESYDKMFCLGHMIIYRNTYENNRVFMSDVDGRYYYKESFTNKNITWFDETWGDDINVNTVFLEKNKRVFMEDWSANFKILPTRFTRVIYKYQDKKYDIEPYRKSLYVWENGSIYQYYIHDGVLKKQEEMYMHFQWRDMTYDSQILDANMFKIVPNRFCKVKSSITNEREFYKESIARISFHYFKIMWKRFNRKLKKIKNRN